MSDCLASITVEPMGHEDIEAVLQIDRVSFPVPWLPAAFSTELSNRSACYLVARCNAEVAGFGGAWVIGEEMHVTTLAVAPAQRGLRIGERLLLALIDEGIRRRASRATLEVRENNVIAQNLYRKFGFYNAAIRRNYYTDNGENAIVMWADNIGSRAFRTVLAGIGASLDAI